MSTPKGMRFGLVALGCAALVVVFCGCSQTSAPIVSFTEPANGSTGVPINTKLAVTFSKAINPQTITATTFTLVQGTAPVAGTVIGQGVTAMFNPAANLAPSTLYTAKITIGVADPSGNALASDYVWTFTTGTSPDTTAPMVSSTYPGDFATSAPINTFLSATFTEAMNPLAFTSAAFTLTQGTTPVAGSVVCVGSTGIFKPTSALLPSTMYTATITTAARDLSGNPLATNTSGVMSTSNYVWTFTTEKGSDSTAPMLSSTDPPNGATGVPPGRRIAATFSKVMDPLSVTASTFTLIQGTTPVPGTVTYSGVTALFTPASALAPNTKYTAEVTNATLDLCLNPLAISRTWTFTTGTDPDATVPTVSAIVPASYSLETPVMESLSATFSETMDPLTINTATFTLAQGTTAIPGTVGYSGVTATFTPADALTADTVYTASILMEATDLAGNALARDYVWTFTTGQTQDITAPVVSFTSPLNQATGLPINRKIAAVFSEAMDPLTLTAASFTLTHGGTTQTIGTASYAGVTATFNPKGSLVPNTQYTARIGANAADLSGNTLGGEKTWTFTTGGALDTTAPSVSSTVPASGATGVPIDRRIAVIFSKTMDPLTISTATFTLDQGTTPVLGTVACAGTSLIFTPKDYLAPGTTHTATVSMEAADLAGNRLASDCVWTFITGTGSDVTAPAVNSTNPSNGMTGVPVGQKITTTFSETMNPLTVTPQTFTLAQGTSQVSGAVICSGGTATFIPTVALAGNTTYTAAIFQQAKDLAGNALAGSHTWTFTTGAAPVITIPTVSSTAPSDGATAVPLNQTITATFSEAMAPWSITPATFTLSRASAPVSGVVTYTPVSGTVTYADGTATFTPVAALVANTSYTATILTTVTDTTGNALANNYTWNFTTGAA